VSITLSDGCRTLGADSVRAIFWDRHGSGRDTFGVAGGLMRAWDCVRIKGCWCGWDGCGMSVRKWGGSEGNVSRRDVRRSSGNRGRGRSRFMS